MQAHPSADRLELFMTGALASGERSAVLRHLVRGCPDCSATTSRLWEVLVTGRQAPQVDPQDYDGAFERAWQGARQVRDTLRLEHEEARELSAELLALPPRQQALRVRNDRRFRTLPLARILLDASRNAIFDNAATAGNLAELALEILSELDRSRYGAAILADARAEAWATQANALREASDLQAAETALQTARHYLDEGTGDPATRAKYLGSLANLLINTRRLKDSLEVIGELEAVYRELGDDHMVGRVQLKKAFALSKMGEFDQEIQLLYRALELLDPASDPKRQLIALHNLAFALMNAGRAEEAAQHLDRLRELHQQQGDELNLLRFRWLEARLTYAMNDLEEAVAIFSEVRAAFIELENGFDLALVSLDLAEALWRQGRRPETRARLSEAIPILKALGVHAEARAAIAFLEHAARVETVSTELIRQTAAFVRRVQADPSARFRPAELASA